MTTTFLETISAPQATEAEIEKLQHLLGQCQLASNEDALLRLADNLRAISAKSQISARKATLEGLYLQLSSVKNRGDLAEGVQDALSVIEREHQKVRFAEELAHVEDLANSDAYPREFISKMLRDLADAVAGGKYSFLPATPTQEELRAHAEMLIARSVTA